MSFELWRQKQKLYNQLYDYVLDKVEKTLPWKNKELSFNKRYKLFLKCFKPYYEQKVNFANKLEEEIFKNNKLDLTFENALALW